MITDRKNLERMTMMEKLEVEGEVVEAATEQLSKIISHCLCRLHYHLTCLLISSIASIIIVINNSISGTIPISTTNISFCSSGR